MGNCSNNCNPCESSCDNIEQLVNKAASYARQAATSAVNAENTSINLSTVYLGAKDAAPSVDNEGNPLIVGALYFNTVSDMMYSWDGTSWVSSIVGANTATTDTNQTITGVKTFTQPIVGNLTGNATTATTLETSRTFNLSGDIYGVPQSFDGSANIVIPSIISNDAVTTSKIQNNAVTATKLGTNEQKQIAKAFVAFNGSTSPYAISNSLNVSSVTRTASSNYTINYATGTFNNTNYTVLVSMNVSSTPTVGNGIPYVGALTAGSTQVYALVAISGSTPTSEANYVAVAVFTSN